MQTQSADGVIHDFPDGTDMSVIDRVMKSYVASAPKRADATAGEQAASSPVWTEGAPDAGVSQTRGSQSQISADVNSVAQGLVGGTGSLVAGAGRQTQAAAAQGTKAQVAVMDAIDRGESVPQDQDAIGYQFLSPEQRAKARADFTTASDDLAKREPNMATRAGEGVKGFANDTFPVAPENEGVQTGVGRMVGGVAPALAATAVGGAVGGPVGGALAAAAVIGSQAYDSTYNEAITSGATPEAAEDAAGKSAATQALTMALPVGRLMRVPVSLREGLARTLINLGQNGVEFGSANAVGTFANNYVVQQTYDPGRALTQGTGDAALEGAIAGLIIPAVGGIARRPRATAEDVMKAPDVDTAIAAAAEAASAPVAPTESRVDPASRYGQAPDFVPPNTEPLPLPRIMALLNEDNRVAANRPDFMPPSADQPPIPKGWGEIFAPKTPERADAALEPASVGAAASREQTPFSQIEASPAEAAANRLQGEVERLATPPRPNDKTLYIPGSKPTLAEATGDPRAAMDQKYNRQQVEAMQSHIEQENHNAEAVADYYADTAGSAHTLDRMLAARDERAKQNIQQVFGDAQSQRPAADPAGVIRFMDDTLADPRMQERDIIQKTIPNLIDRFYNEDGSVKTDPLSLYGIRQHIQDLLNGAGDPETNAAARMLRRELMQVQSKLDDTIEAAAPGFAQYRADYTRDSREIDAMKLLQEARLSLLNKDQHITPAKWFSFMRGIVEGRADPMDPASSLSDDQMNGLWNITDHLKRSTFIDAGKPRDSGTSQLLEWGKRLGMHTGAFMISPGIANLAVPMIERQLRARSVAKEMNRVLNPDLGQPNP